MPLVLAGCDDGGYYDNRYGGGYYGYCDQFETCDECTPVIGCGWCMYGNGQGACFSEPSACRTQQFSWTWEPKGCGATPDAGGNDAGGDASSDGTTSACRWPDTADTFSASDAGASGCLPTTGGDLCSTSQYTLTCYATSTPDAALGCAAAPVTGPTGVAFHCCPCAQ